MAPTNNVSTVTIGNHKYTFKSKESAQRFKNRVALLEKNTVLLGMLTKIFAHAKNRPSTSNLFNYILKKWKPARPNLVPLRKSKINDKITEAFFWGLNGKKRVNNLKANIQAKKNANEKARENARQKAHNNHLAWRKANPQEAARQNNRAQTEWRVQGGYYF